MQLQFQSHSQPMLDPDRLFGALADPTRRDIVLRAIAAEEGVAELASHYPMSFAAVQKHVAVLERAGLVSKQRVGRRMVVRTEVQGLRAAQRLLDDYERLWRERIGRMADLLAQDGHGQPLEADHLDDRRMGGASMDPTSEIDRYIDGLPDWQRRLATRLRALIHEADPDIVESWKWDVPVFAHGRNVCAISGFRDHLKVNFLAGASLPDPAGLFNAGLDAKTSRAIDLGEGDELDEDAFRALVSAAVEPAGAPRNQPVKR